MELGLGGKVAIVSGASKGIGNAVAEELAREGVKLVMTARGAEALDAAVQAIVAQGHEAIGVAADMTVKADVARVAAEARRAFGRVDIVVSNVHPLHRYSFDDSSDEDFEACFRQLVMSVVYLTRETAPGMIENGWGRFINIGSASMREVKREPSLILSNTFRHAMIGLNKSLADEFAPHGITANILAPGWFMTDRLKASHEAVNGAGSWEQLEAARAARTPMRRVGSPSEIAGLCAMLCSDRAAYMTGQVIVVDGGRSTFL